MIRIWVSFLLMVFIFNLRVSGQRALEISTAGWAKKLPAPPDGISDAYKKSRCLGNINCEPPAEFQTLRVQLDKMKKDLEEASKSFATADNSLGKEDQRKSKQNPDLDSSELKEKLAKMSDSEKIQFVSKIQQSIKTKSLTPPAKQESSSTIILLSSLNEMTGRLKGAISDMQREADKLQVSFERQGNAPDLSSCNGKCPYIDAKTREFNERKSNSTARYLGQYLALYSKCRLVVLACMAPLDNYIADLKYGDACNNMGNKRMVLNSEVAAIGAIWTLSDVAAAMYKRGAAVMWTENHFTKCGEKAPSSKPPK